MTAPAAEETVITYAPRGGSKAIFSDHSRELVLTGPARTSKTTAWVEKSHLVAATRPGVRILWLRKTRRSLAESIVPTFEEFVRPELDGVKRRSSNSRYEYPNGSVIVLGGLDNISRIMSSEWDMIVVFECTEITMAEWEKLLTRLSHNKMAYQQLCGDANPEHPTHWLRQRIDSGKTKEYVSYHRDNPLLYDDAGNKTPFGESYLETLQSLTGVRRLRLYEGKWAASEGIVYENWDREKHLVDRFTVPNEWPRDWLIDWGYTNPFCWQCWVQDPDGRIFLYKEIYRTGVTVKEHARAIFESCKLERAPRRIITDPADAGERATLTLELAALGCAVTSTVAATKTLTRGIQQVQIRLADAGDGRPRLFIMRDARIHPPDNTLVEKRLPTSTAEEVEGYIWDPRSQRREAPFDANNHGMDCMRYEVAELDLVGEPDYAPSIYG